MKVYERRAALIRPTRGRDVTAIKLDGFAETNRFRQAVTPNIFCHAESFYVISSTMQCENKIEEHPTLCIFSALDGGEWSASTQGRLFPCGERPQYRLNRNQGG